jgi:hypothetical protein
MFISNHSTVAAGRHHGKGDESVVANEPSVTNEFSIVALINRMDCNQSIGSSVR